MHIAFSAPRAALLVAALAVAGVASAANKPVLVRVTPAPPTTPDRYTRATHDCVTGTRGANTAALASCNAAVEIAQMELQAAKSSTMSLYAVPQARRSLALALSNRAVAHWMLGEAAEADIRRAALLAPHEEAVKTNVVALATPRAETVAAR
jgi:hypothetical protein